MATERVLAQIWAKVQAGPQGAELSGPLVNISTMGDSNIFQVYLRIRTALSPWWQT